MSEKHEQDYLLNLREAFIDSDIWARKDYYFRDWEVTRLDVECRNGFPDTTRTLRGRCLEVFGEYPFERCDWLQATDWDGLPLDKKIDIMKKDGMTDKEIAGMHWDEIEFGEGFDAFRSYARDQNWETLYNLEKQIRTNNGKTQN